MMVVVCMIHSQKACECTIWLLHFEDLSMNINTVPKQIAQGKSAVAQGKTGKTHDI